MKIIITMILTSIYWSNFQSIEQSDYQKEIIIWQEEMNAFLADKTQSPLDKRALRKFDGLDFFAIDEQFRIEARFIRTPNKLPISITTSQGGKQVYEIFGEARFEMDGIEIVLPIYQNKLMSMEEDYDDYLFLPFNDETNGFETYGGGRYLDLKIPEGEVITLDFNKAYNPSCAYNANYICPLPPRANSIPVAIRAGVKAWEE